MKKKKAVRHGIINKIIVQVYKSKLFVNLAFISAAIVPCS
jgi:hypothetical protein